MKSNDIYRAIGDVEDRLLEPQEKKAGNKKVFVFSIRKIRILTAAAVAIVLVCVAIFTPIFKGKEGVAYAKSLMEGVKANEVAGKETDKKFSEGITDYSINLLKNSMKLKDSPANRLVSPYSLLLALGMTANGADKETKAQMQKVMGNIPLEELNEYLYSFNEKLMDSKVLTLANSIWYQDNKDNLLIKPSFLQTNADYYGADAYCAPFNEQTLMDINSWVKQHTDGTIDKMLDKISEDSLMYLINALLFEAKWASPYTKNDVDNREFTNFAGEKYDVPMMFGNVGQIISGDNVKGFLKDYKGKQFSFVALLPKEGMSVDEYIETLTGEEWRLLMKSRYQDIVTGGLPKFKYEDSLLLNEALKQMGMSDAFDSTKSDFSNMADTSKGDLFISEVLQKTFIEVTEAGTKAGAVSSVEAAPTAAMEHKEIILDRPFVYAIIDKSTGIPVFMGVVKDIK